VEPNRGGLAVISNRDINNIKERIGMGVKSYRELSVDEMIEFLERGGRVIIQPGRDIKRGRWDIFRWLSREEVLGYLREIRGTGKTALRVLSDVPEKLGRVFIKACEGELFEDSCRIKYRCPKCNAHITTSVVGSLPDPASYGNYCANCGVRFKK
jgi:hypothetical protein